MTVTFLFSLVEIWKLGVHGGRSRKNYRHMMMHGSVMAFSSDMSSRRFSTRRRSFQHQDEPFAKDFYHSYSLDDYMTVHWVSRRGYCISFRIKLTRPFWSSYF